MLPNLATTLARQVAKQLGVEPPELYEYWMNFTGRPQMATSLSFLKTKRALLDTDVQQALDSSAELAESFPTEPEALALRAYAMLLAAGQGVVDEEELEEALRRLDTVDPGHPTGETIRCEWLYGEEKVECANRVISREDLTPAARAWALRNRVAGYLRLGELARARDDVAVALALDPLAYFNHAQLGLIQARQGDPDAAELSFERAIVLRPGGVAARRLLGELRGFTGNWLEAVDQFAYLCDKLEGAHDCSAYALGLSEAGETARAREAATDPRAMECSCGRSPYLLSCFWARNGDREKATALLQQSFEAGFAGVFGQNLGLRWSCDAPEFESIVAEARRRMG
jgi:tetratricopeptide (TPR) repeat protein